MARASKVHPSSGNVFADLGLPDPEIRLVKADLARHINQVILERNLTQRQAAERMGLTQPDVSDLRRAVLARFSQERLERCLNRLGYDVTIRVVAKGTSVKHVGVTTVHFD